MVFNKRLQILGLFVAAALLLIWTSGQPATQSALVEPLSDTSISTIGVFGVLHGDVQPGTRGHHVTQPIIAQDSGEVLQLASVDSALHFELSGQRVQVQGQLVDADPSSELDAPVLDVTQIRALQVQDGAQAGIEGNERWVNIACRFGDMRDETPQPIEYFQGMMQNIVPGMDHYWRQTSSDLVNIEGSASYGWYNLPRSKAEYERAAAVNTGLALKALMNDCAQLAMQEDDVDFTQFGGINVMLNDKFGCCAWGGRMPLTIDGKSITFRTTWLPPWAFNSLHVIAHEMGHGWGLPHSSGPYGKVYDSAWDVMSGGNSNHTDGVCRIGSEPLGCHQVGTIGLHLEMLGWIPAERIATVNPGQSETVTLDALTTVRAGTDMLLVKVPVQGSSTFYTVEVRSFTGYDRNLPGEAVVLHQVLPGRSSPAHVVDGDNNGNPNDEGAMWLPGETFTESKSGIRVQVLERLGTTFTVRVTNG